jgi:hypothetical protein
MKQITTYIAIFSLVFGVKRLVSAYWNDEGLRILWTTRRRCNRKGRELCTAILCCVPPPHVSLCTGTISRDGRQGSDYRFSNLP